MELQRTYRCDDNFAIQITYLADQKALSFRWLPGEPAGRLTRAGNHAYFEAIDDFMALLRERTGDPTWHVAGGAQPKQ